MTAANAAQETAKVKLGEHLAHLFSTLMKIASILVMQPELILLIDVASGLIEMGIKASVEGEAYDWHEDAKMLAVTAVADVALMGLTKLGKLKGAASLAEKEALSVGEKAATEVGHAATAEAKTEVIHEGAEVAAAESKELTAGVKVAGKGEDVATQEAGAIADKVEQKAGDVAAGKGLTEGESVAAQEGEKVAKQAGEQVAKQAGEDVGKEAAKELTPEELAKKIEAHYALAGGFAKNAISSVGGGLVQGQSPIDILKSFVKGGILLVLPAELAKRAEEAIGDATKAAKILEASWPAPGPSSPPPSSSAATWTPTTCSTPPLLRRGARSRSTSTPPTAGQPTTTTPPTARRATTRPARASTLPLPRSPRRRQRLPR